MEQSLLFIFEIPVIQHPQLFMSVIEAAVDRKGFFKRLDRLGIILRIAEGDSEEKLGLCIHRFYFQRGFVLIYGQRIYPGFTVRVAEVMVGGEGIRVLSHGLFIKIYCFFILFIFGIQRTEVYIRLDIFWVSLT